MSALWLMFVGCLLGALYGWSGSSSQQYCAVCGSIAQVWKQKPEVKQLPPRGNSKWQGHRSSIQNCRLPPRSPGCPLLRESPSPFQQAPFKEQEDRRLGMGSRVFQPGHRLAGALEF